MKNVYFIGIGGIGMSAIARYYKFKGYEVAGYDRTPSDLTHALEAEGIAVHYEDRPDLVPADKAETLVLPPRHSRRPSGTAKGDERGLQGTQTLPYPG